MECQVLKTSLPISTERINTPTNYVIESANEFIYGHISENVSNWNKQCRIDGWHGLSFQLGQLIEISGIIFDFTATNISMIQR